MLLNICCTESQQYLHQCLFFITFVVTVLQASSSEFVFIEIVQGCLCIVMQLTVCITVVVVLVIIPFLDNLLSCDVLSSNYFNDLNFFRFSAEERLSIISRFSIVLFIDVLKYAFIDSVQLSVLCMICCYKCEPY